MKIYLASSWRNKYYPDVLKLIRDAGHDVYDFRDTNATFHWREISPEWESWTTEEFVHHLNNDNRAIAGYINDSDALYWCEALVLLLPSGRSAHLEAGWAVGAGREVAIYSPERMEPELMSRMVDFITGDIDELLNWIQETGALFDY
jgi:hypothetical protein